MIEATPETWFVSGYTFAVGDGIAAATYTDVALEILRVAGVPVADAKAIFEQAMYDAKQDLPDLPEEAKRALAARKIVRHLSTGIRSRTEKVHA